MLVDRHVDDFGFGHPDHLAGIVDAICFDDDPDGYRSVPNAYELRVEAHDVADKDWSYKDHFAHRLCHDSSRSEFPNLDRGRDIDVAQDDSAKDGAVRVCILWHENYADGGFV